MHPSTRQKLIKILANGTGSDAFCMADNTPFESDEIACCGHAYSHEHEGIHVFNKPQLESLLGISKERAVDLADRHLSIRASLAAKVLKMDMECQEHVLTHEERLELREAVGRELGS